MINVPVAVPGACGQPTLHTIGVRWGASVLPPDLSTEPEGSWQAEAHHEDEEEGQDRHGAAIQESTIASAASIVSAESSFSPHQISHRIV